MFKFYFFLFLTYLYFVLISVSGGNIFLVIFMKALKFNKIIVLTSAFLKTFKILMILVAFAAQNLTVS